MIIYIKPECMPYYYSEKDIKTNNSNASRQHIAYTTDGFILPCCWCDAPSTRADIDKLGLYNENLKLKNNNSVDEILTSEPWKKFINIMLHEPESAAKCCREKCGVHNG
jgi:hypothetical protein